MKIKKKLYGIIGLGRFGYSLAESLAQNGQEILALDCDETIVREASSFTDNAFTVGELTKETLKECGIQNCDVVFVCIGQKIDTSILTTLNVLELGVKNVVAKATSPEQGTVLEKLGAQVVYPERDMALRLSKRFTSSVMEFIALGEDFEISELKATRHLNNKTIEELCLRQKYGVNIIAIRRIDGEILTDVLPDTILKNEDTIVVCGKKTGIDKFERSVNVA